MPCHIIVLFINQYLINFTVSDMFPAFHPGIIVISPPYFLIYPVLKIQAVTG